MANLNAPFGMAPVFNGDGSPWNQKTTLYWIASTDTNQYNIGDLVKSLAGVSTTNDLGYGSPAAVKSAASALNVGVVVGCGVDPNALNLINIPATKTHDYYIMVVDDPNTIFAIQDDGITTGNLVSTAVGKNANYTVTNPTSPSPVSATVLNSSTIATTSTLPLKIVGIRRMASNTVGAYCQWLVRWNTHEFFGNTTGV